MRELGSASFWLVLEAFIEFSTENSSHISNITIDNEIEDVFNSILKAAFYEGSILKLFVDHYSDTTHFIVDIFKKLEYQIYVSSIDIIQHLETINTSELNGYVIITDDIDMLKFLVETYEFRPHKNILVMFKGYSNFQIHPFIFGANLKGLDIKIVKGVKYDTERVTVKSIYDNKTLFHWTPGKKIVINAENFARSEWIPRFTSENDTFTVYGVFCPIFFKYDNVSGEFSGLEYQIISEVTRGWPVEYIIENSYEYTKRLDFDYTACGFIQRSVYEKYTTTMEFTTGTLTFLVPKPELLPDFTQVFQPFSLPLWIFLIVVVLLVSVIIHYLSKYYRTNLGVTVSILRSIQYLAGGSIWNFPGQDQTFLRIVFTLWCITCYILSTTYSVGFTTYMTAPRHTREINSVEDMLKYGVKWTSSFKENFLFVCQTFEELADMGILHLDRENFCSFFQKNKVAVTAFASFHSGAISTDQKIDDTCRSRLKPLKNVRTQDDLIVGVLKKNSPYKVMFDKNLRRFWEHGFIKKWHYVAYRKKVRIQSDLFDRYYAYHVNNSKLSTEKLMGAFYFLIIGELVSLVTFIREMYCKQSKLL